MIHLYRGIIVAVVLLTTTANLFSQVKGKVIDASTKEPVAGATVQCNDNNTSCGTVTNDAGDFELKCNDCKSITVSCVGYSQVTLKDKKDFNKIFVIRASSTLDEIVLSANRGEAIKRSQAPVAIALINHTTIQDAKALSPDQLLNKVSGVNVVSLGNEQHEMSIRQPMTTKSLFLYLEDGIPIRTTGLFNHNALLEMNMAAVKSIEVIKGPSSSQYGSEAIGGVVNFITSVPTAVPVLKLVMQGNNIGYERADLNSSFTKGKWGFLLSGYYAQRRNGYLEYTDYNKGTLTGRIDYHFSGRTTLSNSITWVDYYNDMAGGIDSAMFASRSFDNPQTFTYRKVYALRYHSTLTQLWKDDSKTTLSVLYRKNSIGQNPAYRIKDDYRLQGGVFTGRKDAAHGEINESSFNSYAIIAQHRQNLFMNKGSVVAGASIDLSPSTYNAQYIRINKDSVANKYVGYANTDSVLTDYSTNLNNYAAFVNVDYSPLEKLRLVASLRYDLFSYRFNNFLTPSSFSGSPDTTNKFKRVSPKVGFTYNFTSRFGIYANYSEGFVPPQVTELYTGVKVPQIEPSVFNNYEVGGWMELIKNKLSADASVYRLNGKNEIISVKLDDGSFANLNAGRTAHKGIEFGLNANPVHDISLRFSGAHSKHLFTEYVERGLKFDGNEMNNAPRWIYNTEVWYKPSYLEGFRAGAEIQHIGKYYVDPQNTATYDGYDVLNVRIGYALKNLEIWMNVLNATNKYYSYITTKSSFGYSYQLAEPRNFNVGISYDFSRLVKNEK
jgi:outer membrane receptor protein involved in Fe transport